MDAVPELIDIGVNLTHKSFGNDRAAVIERALAAGVRVLIATGTSVAHSRQALTLAQEHRGSVFSTAGVHPHDAARCDEAAFRELRKLAASSQVVAIGECGLDFNRDFSPRPVQQQIFAAQIELALEIGKPLFLHERDAHAALIDILDRYVPPGRDEPPVPIVVHCFTGGAQALADYLDRGFHIGITGWICDERRGRELAQLVPRIPLHRLMVETDAPFLLPRNLTFKLAAGRNEPATLPHIVRTIAGYLGRPFSEVAAQTTANARRFFRLPTTAK